MIAIPVAENADRAISQTISVTICSINSPSFTHYYQLRKNIGVCVETVETATVQHRATVPEINLT